MNVLATDKRAQILNCLVEGCSMRATQRLTGVAKKTVERLLVASGNACLEYQDKTLRNLNCKRLEVDEIWSFTFCKQKHIREPIDGQHMGDTWTWFCLDAETKLIPCWRVDNRTLSAACLFLDDLRERLNHRVQLTTDGLQIYLQAVESTFGSDVDYAQLIKIFESGVTTTTQTRYSQPICTGTKKRRIMGNPKRALISTSYIERANLTLRMSNRRFTRLTNGYSKKVENHKLMLAISMMHYNFCRIHHTLRVTPAMQAGITDHVWSLEEVVDLI